MTHHYQYNGVYLLQNYALSSSKISFLPAIRLAKEGFIANIIITQYLYLFSFFILFLYKLF